jgi:uracil-DNA glycosylase
VNISKKIACPDYPCTDINATAYLIPDIEVKPNQIKIFMIAEAPPPDPSDYFYAEGNPFFFRTTRKAFMDAGYEITSMHDVLNLGVYLTTAIKCGKIGYGVSANTINTCSKLLLEKELAVFPKIQAFLLMGDVAIKAFNYIAERATGSRVVPSGSTYKLREEAYHYLDKRVFPSYLLTGKSYLIEASKQRMIAEDLKRALKNI